MNKKVLIVDDSSYIRSVIRKSLSILDLEAIEVAANGEIAMDLAFELRPDLITLDNVLPDMTGVDILRALKENLPEIKVIMVSAVGQQSVIEEAMGIGAEAYIVKPFTENDLITTVREF